MPRPVRAYHRGQQLERRSGGRPSPVVRGEPVAPRNLRVRRGGLTAACLLSGAAVTSRVWDVHLQVSEGEREPLGPHIRTVREPRIPLLFARLKPKPPELANELIPEVIMASSPSAGIPWAGMRVVSLRVVPPPPPGRAPSASIVAAPPPTGPASRQEWHPQPKAGQRAILGVQETKAVLRRR